jgi:hypothetical protein
VRRPVYFAISRTDQHVTSAGEHIIQDPSFDNAVLDEDETATSEPIIHNRIVDEVKLISRLLQYLATLRNDCSVFRREPLLDDISDNERESAVRKIDRVA